MQTIFELLSSPTVHFEVQKYLIGVLLNLTMEPEIEEKADEDSYSLAHSEKIDAKPIKCSGIYQFNNSGNKFDLINLI